LRLAAGGTGKRHCKKEQEDDKHSPGCDEGNQHLDRPNPSQRTLFLCPILRRALEGMRRDAQVCPRIWRENRRDVRPGLLGLSSDGTEADNPT
jgi:hypothetical protein